MHPIQLAYCHAKERYDHLELEAFQRIKETHAFNTLPPNWEHIVSTQERIEQELGLPASRVVLRDATDARLSFALAWGYPARNGEARSTV